MNQYLITGYDHTDEGALKRRMDVRPHHLDGARELRDNNNYVMGGAILDDDGKMIGSVMVLQFETEEELEAWKQREIYITAGVWETVDVKPFRVAFSVATP
jgi:uncharacterized protein YciI